MRLFNNRNGMTIRGLWLALLIVSATANAQWTVEGYETEDESDSESRPGWGSIKGCIYRPQWCEKQEEDETVGDTWDIVEATVQCTDCYDWSPIGLCFWLDIEVYPPSATVKTTVLVKNFIPDFVVTAYSNQTPYPEMGGLTDRNNGAILTEKMDWHGDANQIDTNLDFKHVDIITNPAIPIFNAFGQNFEWACESAETIPYFPHYISDKDPAWEEAIIEQFYPQALLGMPRMSRLPDFWGPIYPRTGWTSLPHDAMSALVVAERASEIVTGGFSAHLFIPPGSDCGDKCWPPSAVKVDDWGNRFQQIFPAKHIDDDAAPLPRNATWIGGREYGHQKYAWAMWRRYECCKRDGEIFIERVVIDGDYGGNGRGHEKSAN